MNNTMFVSVNVPSVMISQTKTPKDQTSLFVVYSLYMIDSGAIHLTGSAPYDIKQQRRYR